MSSPLPASLTKHLDTISHPLPRDNITTFSLRQLSSVPAPAVTSHPAVPASTPSAASTTFANAPFSSSSSSATRRVKDENESTGTTGTTLWLGGQVLSCYLSSLPLPTCTTNSRGEAQAKQAIELGAGVGYLTLVLASLGYDVVSTDIPPVLDIVLRPNIDEGQNVLARKSSFTPLFSGKTARSTTPGSVLGSATGKSAPSGSASKSGSSSIPKVGSISVRELDWVNVESGDEIQIRDLNPDLIVTSDTIYHPTLIPCLYTTIARLSTNSLAAGKKPPVVYLCLERRDTRLVDSAIAAAAGYGITFKRVGHGRIAKSVEKTGWGWKEEDWEGVEVYRGRWAGVEQNGQNPQDSPDQDALDI